MNHTANDRAMDGFCRALAGQRLEFLFRDDDSGLHVDHFTNRENPEKCVRHILESASAEDG